MALLAALFLFEPIQSFSKVLMVLWIILAAALLGRLRLLVTDWLVFMAFLFLFDSLRGTIYVLTCRLQLPVHALYVLKFERALFGEVPSVSLQNLLLRTGPAGPFSWLEKTLSVFYGSHFVAFLFVGLLIWIYRPGALARYKKSFYLLVSLGTLFYAIAPTVPPWMASGKFGLLPPLIRFNRLLFDSAIPVLTGGFDLNPVSAMPSLHAGFPVLCCLILWGLCRWKALPFYLYALTVLFTVVYTGDHYVTDVLAGLVLAVFCYLAAARFPGGRESPPPEGPRPSEGGALLKGSLIRPVLTGLLIFLAGAGAGWVNRALVTPGVDFFDTDVPRYADFLGSEDRYRDSFSVQLYFGNHYLAWKDQKQALGFFERSRELARTAEESREARAKIAACRRALSPPPRRSPPSPFP